MARQEQRRKFLIAAALTGAGGLLAAYEFLVRRKLAAGMPKTRETGTDSERVIEQIRELDFAPGSEIRTTIFPRKIMWELAQVRKKQDRWSGGDESGWMSHEDEMEKALGILENWGVKGGRLAVVNFELTEDGRDYNWEPLDRGIEMMSRHGMRVDLAAGPVDYPYGPGGVRLPRRYEEALRGEMERMGQKEILVSLKPTGRMAETAKAIRDFGLEHLQKIMERFGRDERIDKIFIGNEWPDVHEIEGVPGGRMKIATDLMERFVEIGLELSDKKIGLNTNIHPSRIERLEAEYGTMLRKMEGRGVLGIDAYPTREAMEPMMAALINRYGRLIGNLRKRFPETEISFVELQGELWPPEGVGGAWVDIIEKHRGLVDEYFLRDYLTSLRYAEMSRIREIGLWGAPLWVVAEEMGYGLPKGLLEATTETMKERK